LDHGANFKIYCVENKAPATVASLKIGFRKLQEVYQNTSVKVVDGLRGHPEHLTPLMTKSNRKESGSLIIGISVPTIYENVEESEVYPLFYRKFYSLFSEAIKRAAFDFIRVQTLNPFNHYLMFGKTRIDRFTIEADKKLAAISEVMKFLLRVTPVNSASEWKKFKESEYTEEPSFIYRLISLDPEKKKRELYNLDLNQIEDPTLALILRDKRLEIEKKLTMLEERGTDNFQFIGESLFGKIEDNVLQAAKAILRKYPKGENPKSQKRFDCYEFAARAKDEIDYYQEQFPDLKLSLEIRKDVSGIMVDRSKLLISNRFSLNESRCDALIQHEIATHIVTYCNGKGQPIRQMYAGFAGYDQLQEGLAVLAEYLVGGLTVNRLRLLGARVIAADSLVNGANFIETFNLLRIVHNFPESTAYYITMRIYRGGGLTKDAVYLAGLLNVMEYIKNGGNLERLYTGKFNVNHVEIIEELLHRRILNKPVIPRFLRRELVQERLKIVSNGLKVTELLD